MQPFITDLERRAVSSTGQPCKEEMPNPNALGDQILTYHLSDDTYPGYSLQNAFFLFFLFPTDSNRNKILDNFLRIISSSNTMSQKMNVDAVMSMKAEGYF